jgi:hypothetical protein
MALFDELDDSSKQKVIKRAFELSFKDHGFTPWLLGLRWQKREQIARWTFDNGADCALLLDAELVSASRVIGVTRNHCSVVPTASQT